MTAQQRFSLNGKRAIVTGASRATRNPSIDQSVIRQTPLGRHGQPDEDVGIAIFLGAHASDFMTGHVLVVDGGVRM